MSSNDEMISLNLSEKPARDLSAYALRCPGCGSTVFQEFKPPEEERGGITAIDFEYNYCGQCKIRFNDDGEQEAPYHEAESIVKIFGLMGLVAVLVALGMFISRFFE